MLVVSRRFVMPARNEGNNVTKWTHHRSIFVPVQQLPETSDPPSSATELLLGLQPCLWLSTLQDGRRPLCETALGLLHPRAVSALQPVAVTIRELSEPPPYAHDRGWLVSSLLQVDLPVSDDRALESSPRDLLGDLTMANAHGGRDLSWRVLSAGSTDVLIPINSPNAFISVDSWCFFVIS